MINSRSLDELATAVADMARAHIAACLLEGIDLLITSTYRDLEAQAEIYAQGRTKPGRIVTWADAGQSLHNYRVAYDVVPLRAGKPVWGTKEADRILWLRIGELGEQVGLEWAGRWPRRREFPHFQYLGGLTKADLRAGRLPERTPA